MTEKLKPCPFCSNEEPRIQTGTVKWPDKEDTIAYFVQCSKCLAQAGYFTSETAAINAWNTRAYEQEAK